VRECRPRVAAIEMCVPAATVPPPDLPWHMIAVPCSSAPHDLAALALGLESMLRLPTLKIVLQHILPKKQTFAGPIGRVDRQ
jgi:hypothetical protein